ncbi:MAG TPA: GDL motif peptide-associated radical SAM/SPASM maturase [Pyrinomonadaceae bacterium]|nr:GDL motif peptide-associated radical SAM/SPASM maturase [Pyrinomonadaceae bacterium]
MPARRSKSRTAPTRYLSSEDRSAFVPVHAVWEITLACDLKCQHCGSRAGKRRSEELNTEECLDLVRQLAAMGTREVTLIGGEAYLRRDWLQIIREIRDQGMDCTMQSGGLHLTEERIKAAVDAGLQALGISVDGLRELHDKLRGVKGSFEAAFNTLRLVRKCGITSSVNTQITALVIPQLRELMNRFIDAGAKNWQVQLTVAMGRAADHPELLLQPFELLALMPLLAELYEEGADRGLLLQPGNNIGYFGPYESKWRGSGDDRVYWTSCNAGENTLGIEADGTIKGCPSLPTHPYAGGKIRDLSLENIWWNTEELAINRSRTSRELWGFCGSCYYANVCKAGCTWTSHSLLGRAGNNPFCHHRALELSKQGLRERIVQVEKAPGVPFDHGRFELILEKSDASTVGTIPLARNAPNALVQITPTKRVNGRSSRSEELILCRGCSRHVFLGTRICPFCDGDIDALEKRHKATMREARRAYARLAKLLPPSVSASG